MPKTRQFSAVFLLVAVLLFATFATFIQVAKATTLNTIDFEENNFTDASGTAGTPAIISSIKHGGSYAANTTGEYNYWYVTVADNKTDIYVTTFIYFPALPTSGSYDSENFIQFSSNASDTLVVSIADGGGAGVYYWGIGGNLSQQTILAATWYNVTAHWVTGVGSGTADMWVDGTLIMHNTGMTNSGGVNEIDVGVLYAGTTGFKTYTDDGLVFDATASDTTAPTYTSLSTSTTVAGASSQFNSTWTDETGLATTGGYIFGTNNTGVFTNETWASFTANPQTVSVSKTLNATVGNVVQWQVWANDTSNNWNNTGLQSITLTDGSNPSFGSVTSNSTVAGAGALISVTVSDNNAIDKVWYEHNNTGVATNQTALSGSGTSYIANHTLTWNSTVGNVIRFRVFANDTAGNTAISSNQDFTLTDGNSPTFGAITGTTTVAGASVTYSVTISDNAAVSGFIASWNNTGSWVNGTWTSGGAGSLVGTHNSTVGLKISVIFYANDTSNNWATSATATFTLTDGNAPTFGAITANVTIANSPVFLSVTVSDNIAVDKVIFSWNNTGIWVNQTALSGSGTSYIANFSTGTLNITVGSIVSVLVYSNDTTNNWGTSTQYNFTTTYIYLTIQARDASGVNLPRSVTFKGTLPNSTSLNQASSTAGLYTLATTYGTHTLNTWWGTNLVNASLSYSATANATINIDTQIQRLDWVSNYALISLNNTAITTPALEGEADILIRDISASGSLQLKIDHLNWKKTIEPARLEIGGRQYNLGDGNWSWTSSVLTLTDTYADTQTVQLKFPVSVDSGGGGGAASPPDDTTTPPPTDTAPSGDNATDTTPPFQFPEINIPLTQDDILIGTAIVAVAIMIAATVTTTKVKRTRKLRRPEDTKLPKFRRG